MRDDNASQGSGIGIKKQIHRRKVTQLLSKILGEEYILFTKTKNAHEHLREFNSCDTYQFFEAQCSEFETIVESVGERIRTFGSYVDAMLAAFVTLSNTKDLYRKENGRFDHLSELHVGHKRIIILLEGDSLALANNYDDQETFYFIKGLTDTHEKMSWFLRSHLKFET